MSLINELKTKSANAESIKSEVIAEIKTYFDKYLNSDALENYLRACIGKSEIESRKVYMDVQFWEYHDGCTTTNFRCGGRVWYNPETKDGWNSHYYKGVELKTIDQEVGNYLCDRLVSKMNELGFYVASKEHRKSRLGYFEVTFYFGW